MLHEEEDPADLVHRTSEWLARLANDLEPGVVDVLIERSRHRRDWDGPVDDGLLAAAAALLAHPRFDPAADHGNLAWAAELRTAFGQDRRGRLVLAAALLLDVIAALDGGS